METTFHGKNLFWIAVWVTQRLIYIQVGLMEPKFRGNQSAKPAAGEAGKAV